MVDKNVYDKATHLANKLNTNVDGIIALAAYNIIKKEPPPFTPFVDHKHDIKKTSPTLRRPWRAAPREPQGHIFKVTPGSTILPTTLSYVYPKNECVITHGFVF